jgi:hypothetical protein
MRRSGVRSSSSPPSTQSGKIPRSPGKIKKPLRINTPGLFSCPKTSQEIPTNRRSHCSDQCSDWKIEHLCDGESLPMAKYLISRQTRPTKVIKAGDLRSRLNALPPSFLRMALRLPQLVKLIPQFCGQRIERLFAHIDSRIGLHPTIASYARFGSDAAATFDRAGKRRCGRKAGPFLSQTPHNRGYIGQPHRTGEEHDHPAYEAASHGYLPTLRRRVRRSIPCAAPAQARHAAMQGQSAPARRARSANIKKRPAKILSIWARHRGRCLTAP